MEEKNKELHQLTNKIRDGFIDTVATDEEAMLKEDMRRRMIISLIFVLPLVLVGDLAEGHAWSFPLTVVFCLPIIVVNLQCYRDGFKAFRTKHPEKNLLAAVASIIAMICLQFTTAGIVLTTMAVCRFFESYINYKLDAHLKALIAAEPDAGDLTEGDVVKVEPGMRIPADGIIVAGRSAIDEELITGDRIPSEKTQGELAFAGTRNVTSNLRIQVTRTGEKTIISQIIEYINGAIVTKPPLSLRAEKTAKIFVLAVFLIAALIALVWIHLGMPKLEALMTAVSVLIIANPYAFSSTIPMSVLAATIRGAENGILVRSADILESTRDINTIVMNKTGTITSGVPEISDVLILGESFSLALVGALESCSTHPIGRAILQVAQDQALTLPKAEQLEEIPGRGVRGLIDGVEYLAGNSAMMEEKGIFILTQDVEDLLQQGKSLVYVAGNEKIIGIIAMRDGPKPGSLKAISQIENMGIDVVMLTGDSKETANAIKEEVGIDYVFAQTRPEDKRYVVRKIREEKDSIVAMVGDGITDAAAIDEADLGIAVGTGRDINIESGDIVLVTDDLLDVVRAIRLSRLVNRNIRQEMVFAYCYNIVGIVLAGGLLLPVTGITIVPLVAAICMCGSQFLVTAWTMRTKKARL